MKKILITATGTGIGKTFVTASLARQLRAKGQLVTAIKPIISGWDDGNETDTKILMQACGLSNVDECSPWRFKAPLSIDMAASREGRKVDFEELVKFCNLPFDGTKLIEGAGGIMSPINSSKTFLDLVRVLECKIILVAGSYLGSISHTLTALEVLKGLDVTLIISESEQGPV